MKLHSILKPIKDADDVYNVVVDNCEFFVDKNGEAFLISYINNDYVLVYLSYSDNAKQFFIDLYFDRYN